MTGTISCNRLPGSLKETASWPGTARSTGVLLATALVAARADAEGSRYFHDLSEPGPSTSLAVAARQELAAAPRTDVTMPADRGHDEAPRLVS